MSNNLTDRHTGYPSIDKPWLKYYSEEAVNMPLPECSLYDYLLSCNKEHMEDYALNYFGNKITYRKFFNMIDDVAKSFLKIGVKDGEVVPIVSLSTVASIVCFYALNRIGAVVDFLNVLAEQADLENFFNEANARTVVTLDLFGEKVVNAANKTEVQQIVLFSVDYEMPLAMKVGYHLKTRNKKENWRLQTNIINWNTFLALGKDQPNIQYSKNPYKMCLLAHTGGTTGNPKAVMLSDKAMNAVICQYINVFGINRREVFLSLIVPFVVYGILSNVHLPLCLGLETVIIPRFDANEWGNYFKKYHPNHVLAVPSYVSPMLKHPKLQNMDLSCFISAGVGGDGMTNEIETDLNEFYRNHNSNALVLKGYGMTEVCATAITCFPGINKIGSVGIPLPKVNLMIYDRDKKCEMKNYEIGEICLQSPSRMIGYLNNEEETNNLFWHHEDGSEWLHTGDLGYIDEDGYLFLSGRMKRVILTTGKGIAYKVFPNIPEKILDSHESVVQSCIVGAVDGDNQVLRAHIMVNGADMSKTSQIEKELRTLCEEHLPEYSRPVYYTFHEKLPLTSIGKVDYRALEQV